MQKVYLSRRNLQTLLSKLDRKKDGDDTACAIIKSDNKHKVYPQTMKDLIVQAIEDDEYYTDREPGVVHPKDRPEPRAPDLNTCPGCGGPADNGHDRCVPPNPYYCTGCSNI